MSRPYQTRKPRRFDRAERPDETLIYGTHAVEAALANPRRTLKKLWLTENAENRLQASIDARKVPTERVMPRDLDRRLGEDTVHQGVLLECDPLPDVSLGDLVTAGGPVVVLDQVTDPHNVGAILRSAAVFGAAGLVMTRRHSAAQTGALAKAASGALDIVPIALVQNLARALEELSAMGFVRIGLDGAAGMLLEDAPLDQPVAIVLGAEGKGLRQLTSETCDHLCRIAAPGPIASLNVSNAAAVSLHLIAMRRRKAY
jgi:23S rRNA (guanosine2251-2'-O)-methyltransferase